MLSTASARSHRLTIIACYAIVFLAGLCFWVFPIHDPDLGFHLLGGSWVYHTGGVPRQDFINVLNASWVDYHWLGQWVIYLFYRCFGMPGVQAVCGLIGAGLGVVLLTIALQSQRRTPPLLALCYVVGLQWITFGLISTRPTSIAVLVVAVAYCVLLRLRERALISLFLLTCLCANIHIYWILIAVLWGLHFCFPRFLPCRQPRLQRASALRAWGGLLALVFAGAVSPYGIFSSEPGLNAKFANYYVFVDVAINPAWIKRYVTELQPGLSHWGSFAWYTLASVILVARFATLPRLRARLFSATMFVVSFLMLIEARKYAILFAIFSTPLVMPILVRCFRVTLRSTLPRAVPQALPLTLLVVLMGLGVVAVGLTSPFRESNAAAAAKELQELQPLAACTAIKELFPTPEGVIRVAAPYDRGGWCAWVLNQGRVPSNYRLTFDGRTQFVPPERIVDGFNLFFLGSKWRETLEKMNPDVVVVGYDFPLGQILDVMKDEWRLVYKNESFGLFLNRRSLEKSVLKSPTLATEPPGASRDGLESGH